MSSWLNWLIDKIAKILVNLLIFYKNFFINLIKNIIYSKTKNVCKTILIYFRNKIKYFIITYIPNYYFVVKIFSIFFLLSTSLFLKKFCFSLLMAPDFLFFDNSPLFVHKINFDNSLYFDLLQKKNAFTFLHTSNICNLFPYNNNSLLVINPYKKYSIDNLDTFINLNNRFDAAFYVYCLYFCSLYFTFQLWYFL